MGKIFYIIGPSASGKDSLAAAVLEHFGGRLRTALMCSTRPIRSGERQNDPYHFISAEEMAELEAEGKVIEARTYQTVYGPWTYATTTDAFDLEHFDYLMVGTLDSYLRTRGYFGGEAVVPLYIELDKGLRLQRALDRERRQAQPKYAELCRRFLADEEDFSDEKIAACGFERVYVNDDFGRCVEELCAAIAEVLA